MELVLASGNKGKIVELKQLLATLPITVKSLADYPTMPETVEDGESFQANAIKKAQEAAQFTGKMALADDSGLEVDSLAGLPGVESARFAGEPTDDAANNRKLLAMMKNIPQSQRRARFRCVMAICTPQGEIFTSEGSCEGLILQALQGQGGFGYDPLFYVPDFDKTFAELDLASKNKISHRGQALTGVLNLLTTLVTDKREGLG